MTTKLVAACIQTNAGPEIEPNLQAIAPLIEDAAKRGAQLITLPENVSLMICGRDKLFARVSDEATHPAITFFRNMAQKTGTWILAGSIAIHLGEDRLANRSFLFNPAGEIAARYDKIHMFDATISENESYRESSSYRGGDRAIVADTPWGKIGLTICYDVRFPHLHRALAKAGASLITAPAAFAASTGKMHWHVLLRARAIETGCFVIAPAQCGQHDGQRQTFGHSMIIGPSGQIIVEAGEEPGIIMAELDLAEVEKNRRMLPCLEHDCVFTKPEIG